MERPHDEDERGGETRPGLECLCPLSGGGLRLRLRLRERSRLFSLRGEEALGDAGGSSTRGSSKS